MTWRAMAAGLAMAAAIGLSARTASADFVYGLNSDGQLVSINTGTGATQRLTDPKLSDSNGLAIDQANGILYFRAPSTGQMYKYDLSAGGTSATAITVSGSGGTASNAAFWNGSYWFVSQNTNALYKVDMSDPNNLSYETAATLGGVPTTAQGGLFFGDMAITHGGSLYMSTNQGFYTANLAALSGGALQATRLGTFSTALQLTFLPDGSLIGQDFTNGKWYSIDITNGATTLITKFPNSNVSLPTMKFRDLAGASVPEPSSVALLGLGVGASLAFARRRMKTHA